MGIRNAIAVWRNSPVATPVGAPIVGTSPRQQIASPWATGDLTKIVWADIFGLDLIPPTREQAMQVASLARAVNLFKTTIARCPLVGMTRDVPMPENPLWTQRTDGITSPFHRMLWTVDDHIFNGESLWIRTNNADGSLKEADRMPFEEWSVDSIGRILINGEPAGADEVIYLPGPHEGILRFGTKAIRSAAAVETSALDTALHPFRVHLHQTTDEEMSAKDKAELIANARAALYENFGVMFTNSAVTAELMTFDSSQLLVEGRNAASGRLPRGPR
jgi:hypothetical protein